MISFLLFIGSALLLAYEGRMFISVFAGSKFTRIEQWFLGFAIGAFINVLIFFFLTVLGITLSFWIVYGLHLILIIVLQRCFKSVHCDNKSLGLVLSCKKNRMCTAFTIFLAASITIKLLFAFSHALFLPSYYYDTLSQWNMRAKISYEDRAIAFDTEEVRGHSKPQYPILLHSLQIYFMQPQEEWSNSVANGGTLMFSITAFTAFALLLVRLASPFISLLTLALMLMIPLVPYHLGQGYGDVHVIEYVLLSVVLLLMARGKGSEGREGSEGSLLMLSALFIVAASWVKMDGLVFGVVPWLIIVSLYCFPRGKHLPLKPLLLLLPTVLLWPLLLFTKGLPLSPHPGDFAIQWHPEAIKPMLDAMFVQGSFGIFWYAVPVVLLIELIAIRKHWKKFMRELLVILFGLITLFEVLFIYLFTPNVQFLLNAQTFSRTMLIPLVLLIFGGVLIGNRIGKQTKR